MGKYLLWHNGESDKHRRCICLLAAAGFIAGIVMANLSGRKLISQLGIFGEYFWMQLGQIKLDAGVMFWYVFEKRMLLFLIVLVFGVTGLGTTLVYMLAAWMGGSLGFLFSAAVIQKGIGGLVMCVMGFVPHGLFYLPAGILMMLKTCRLSDRLHGRDKSSIFSIKKELTSYAIAMAVVFVVLFLGIILESMLNPILLQKIYKIFNNI